MAVCLCERNQRALMENWLQRRVSGSSCQDHRLMPVIYRNRLVVLKTLASVSCCYKLLIMWYNYADCYDTIAISQHLQIDTFTLRPFCPFCPSANEIHRSIHFQAFNKLQKLYKNSYGEIALVGSNNIWFIKTIVQKYRDYFTGFHSYLTQQ
jgi:hypothetical protein